MPVQQAMSIMGTQRGPALGYKSKGYLFRGSLAWAGLLMARVGWKESTEPFHVAGSKEFCTEPMYRMLRSPTRLWQEDGPLLLRPIHQHISTGLSQVCRTPNFLEDFLHPGPAHHHLSPTLWQLPPNSAPCFYHCLIPICSLHKAMWSFKKKLTM